MSEPSTQEPLEQQDNIMYSYKPAGDLNFLFKKQNSVIDK